jgi:hypothetical protein
MLSISPHNIWLLTKEHQVLKQRHQDANMSEKTLALIMVNLLEKQAELVKLAIAQLKEYSNVEAKSKKDDFMAKTEPTAAQLKKQRKKLVDPNKPKRSPSGYHLFMSVHTNAYKEAHPDKNQTEVMTVIAKKWTESTEEEKTVYLLQAATLKGEYEIKLKAYNDCKQLTEPSATSTPPAATSALAEAYKKQAAAEKGKRVGVVNFDGNTEAEESPSNTANTILSPDDRLTKKMKTSDKA